MLILISQDLYNIVKSDDYLKSNISHIEYIEVQNVNEDGIDISDYVFWVEEKDLENFVKFFATHNVFFEHDSFDLIKFSYDNERVTLHRRLHPSIIREYISFFSAFKNDIQVYVNDKLLYVKRIATQEEWLDHE